jgi:transposase
VTGHFNNPFIRNTKTVMRQLEQSGFKRVEYPRYSPDLARVTSFFGYMIEQLKRRNFAEEEEL